MRFELPKIYPITDVQISRRSHLEQVKTLIDHGAAFIQLREKNLSPKEFVADASDAVQYAHDRNAKIIINDRVDIAKITGADGVHLGQDDLPPEAARKLLGENAIIGFSTHTASQATTALKLPVDYLAIGPIFATTTKKDAEQTVGLEGLTEVRKLTGKLPLVAIGGINMNDLSDVLSCGADSAAMISAIYSDPQNLELFSEINNTGHR